MSAAHTPGPLRADSIKYGERGLLIGEGTKVHRVLAANGCPLAYLDCTADDAGNARLFAAAPDIVTQAAAFTYTVERFMRAGDGSDPRVPPTETELADAMYALRAAIAKATGSAA